MQDGHPPPRARIGGGKNSFMSAIGVFDSGVGGLTVVAAVEEGSPAAAAGVSRAA